MRAIEFLSCVSAVPKEVFAEATNKPRASADSVAAIAVASLIASLESELR